MATVNKNFRVKHGLVVEGSTATVNGNNILTETASDSYILNLIGGETLVKSVESTQLEVDGSGKLSVKANVFDAHGAASTAESNANSYTDTALESYTPTSSLDTTVGGYGYIKIGDVPAAYITSTTSEFSVNNGELSLDQLNGLTQVNPASGFQPNNGYGTIEYVDDTVAGTEGLRIKAERGWVGSQIGGQLDLDAYRDVVVTSRNGNIVLNADGDTYLGSVGSGNDIATTGYVDGLASNYDPAGAASTAESNANTYTNNLIGDNTIDGTAGNTVKARIDSAIAALVDSAPALLDTLNELAAAIADNPNYATDMATALSGKQNTLTASTGITIDGSNNISVTANTYDAYGAASTAQTNAEGYADTVAGTAEQNAKNYADGLASNYDPAGAATTAENNANSYTDSAIQAGNVAATPTYGALNIGYHTQQVGNWVTGSAATPVTAFAYGTTWGSAEFLVRVMSNLSGHQHSQLSKILITTDGAGNIGITEYGIVTTNGTMGDVTADVSGGQIRVRVTPQYDNSEIIVHGTLLAYND